MRNNYVSTAHEILFSMYVHHYDIAYKRALSSRRYFLFHPLFPNTSKSTSSILFISVFWIVLRE